MSKARYLSFVILTMILKNQNMLEKTEVILYYTLNFIKWKGMQMRLYKRNVEKN